MITIEQIKAVMIGHAIGDALGVPVEFCSREELKPNPVTDMRGYGTYPVPAGSWSDDTSMSIAALDSLAKGTINYNEIMDNFVSWVEDGKYTPTGKSFDIGRTCLEAIRAYLITYNANECGQNNEYSNGNGSLMRIHPFVLFVQANMMPYTEWIKLIENGSAITHAHDRSKLGCLIYAFVLIHLLGEPSKYALLHGLKRAECHLRDYPEIEHYKRLFSNNFEDITRDEIRSSGYVVDTLEAALWCVLTTKSYKECVLKAVNLGEDTDTVAAIAGGLAGAMYGYDSIPQEWKDTLIKRDYIERLCEKAYAEWAKGDIGK